MDLNLLKQQSPFEWHIPPFGAMRVPGVIYTNEMLIRDMDMKVYEQVTNVATLPGIVRASYAMPDAHWGYGFPIGGVAPSILMSGAGGVGFDISCGVRLLRTGLTVEDLQPVKTHWLRSCSIGYLPASGAPANCIWTGVKWMPCSQGVPAGRWIKAMGCRSTWNLSRNTAAWREPNRNVCRIMPRRGNRMRWVRSDPGIITLKCNRW